MTADLVARFRVARGELALAVDLVAGVGVTAVRGPSGAGKSSIVAVLVGALAPSTGVVRFGETTWLDTDTKVALAPERRRLGVVFQSLALFPHLSALGNVTFGLGPAAEAKARGLLARLGIEGLAARYPRSFSGGEAQRVALARALVRDSDVLLLDEPFSALDDAAAERARGVLREELAAHPRVVVMVTHADADVTAFGARELVVADGRLVARD